MKKQVLILLIAVIAGISSYAQCDKKVVLTASSTEYLDGLGAIRRTVEEPTTIEFDSKAIVITPGDHVMEGAVDSISCDWKIPYKEGKMVIKATIPAGDGRVMKITITIEGKDGKIILLFEESADRRIRLTADKFEEKK